MECQLWMEGDSAKPAFHLLSERKEEIIATLGADIKFDEMPGKKSCVIYESKSWDISNRNEWTGFYSWLKQRGEAYVGVFKPLVSQLKLG